MALGAHHLYLACQQVLFEELSLTLSVNLFLDLRAIRESDVATFGPWLDCQLLIIVRIRHHHT